MSAVVEVGTIERRPGRRGAAVVSLVPEWGDPPSLEARALTAWLRFKILDGQTRALRGEAVPWVAPVERRG